MSPPKIDNHIKVVNHLRDSRIAEYQNIQSEDDIINLLLSNSSSRRRKKAREIKDLKEYINSRTVDKTEIKKGENVLNAISDVLQSITTEAITTTEMLEILYSKYTEEVISYVGNFIKIIHSEKNNIKYKTGDTKKFKDTPFCLKKEIFGKGNTNHKNEYGLTSKSSMPTKKGEIFNVEEICSAKLEATGEDKNAPNSYVNSLDEKGRVKATKENPSMSCILVDSPELRIGTRNSLELSTFFNTLSTVELSKCQPFFNATFILPNLIENSQGTTFKTASITQFLDGTSSRPKSFDTDVYNKIEASINRVLDTRKDKVQVQSVSTNISAFTMPQTINNFNEKFIGHNENINLNTDFRHLRSTSVHDITKPFMTIKSFTIDVAPTQGLMSFKTGKLSIVLHDRTRMVDIAPFIKPDLFGSYGAEIVLEYGWRHTDSTGTGTSSYNYLSEFLNNSRVTEKYIITNSSFNMDNTGQVNIDLSIAMRGPVDIRSVMLKSDPEAELSRQSISKSCQAFDSRLAFVKNFTNSKDKITIQTGITSKINQEINGVDFKSKTFKLANLKACAHFNLLARKISKQLGELNSEYAKLNKRERKKYKKSSKSIYKVNTLEKILFIINKNFNTSPNKSALFGDNPIKIFVNGQQVTPANSYKTKFEDTQKKVYKDGKASFSAVDVVRTTFVREMIKIAYALGGVSRTAKEAQEKQDKLIKKLVGGINKADPFYNKTWLCSYNNIIKKDKNYEDESSDATPVNLKMPIKFITEKSDSLSGYVTFGNFLLGLIGTHLSNTGKFDEIQLVFYTTNEHCGMMSNLNVSSFLINKKELGEFLDEMFREGISMTIESVVTQVIERFISTRLQVCYGLSDLYKRSKTGTTESVSKDSKVQNLKVDQRLELIYRGLAASTADATKGVKLEDIRFVMPKIKLTFDTITSKKSGFEKTISRVSIFDQNDNPFASVNTIMKNVYDTGIVTVAAQLNKLRARYKAGEKIKGHKLTRRSFYKKSQKLIKMLEDKGMLSEVQGSEGIYQLKGQFQIDTIKNSLKKIMPSLTYGTQNSAIIDASVSTVNEAKLNTIYLTRNENTKTKKTQAIQVRIEKDLPLRVLPSQAQITVFGCPFVNFAQYIFLDFETGTTIDNAYAITGIKHDLTPGKFTTQLTLSYGDVYGKYENSATSIARALNELQPKVTKDQVAKADSPRSADIQTIDYYTKGRPVELGDNIYGSITHEYELSLNDFTKSVDPKWDPLVRLKSTDYIKKSENKQIIKIKTNIRHWKEDLSYIFKETTSQIPHKDPTKAAQGDTIKVVEFENNIMLDSKNEGKQYRVKLDLLEHSNIFKDILYEKDSPLNVISEFSNEIFFQIAGDFSQFRNDDFISKFGGSKTEVKGLFKSLYAIPVEKQALKGILEEHLSLFYSFEFKYTKQDPNIDGNTFGLTLEAVDTKKTKLFDLFTKHKVTKKEFLENCTFNMKYLKDNFNYSAKVRNVLKNKKLTDVEKNNKLIELADEFIEEFVYEEDSLFITYVESVDKSKQKNLKEVEIPYKDIIDSITKSYGFKGLNLTSLLKIDKKLVTIK